MESNLPCNKIWLGYVKALSLRLCFLEAKDCRMREILSWWKGLKRVVFSSCDLPVNATRCVRILITCHHDELEYEVQVQVQLM